MCNRIRNGLPLSHQVALHEPEQERLCDEDKNLENSNWFIRLKEKQLESSPDQQSENIPSSDVNTLRVSRIPIGT